MAQINSYRYRTKATGDKSRTQSVDYRWGAPVTGKLARGWDVRETVDLCKGRGPRRAGGKATKLRTARTLQPASTLLLGRLHASVLILTAAARAVEMAKFKVMSFNARMDTTQPDGGDGADGGDAWPHRREWLARNIEAFDPDLLGMQEVRGPARDARERERGSGGAPGVPAT